MRPLFSVETTDAKHAVAACHVPEGRRPQTQYCDKVKTCDRTKYYSAGGHSTTQGIPQTILRKIKYNETKKKLLIKFGFFFFNLLAPELFFFLILAHAVYKM